MELHTTRFTVDEIDNMLDGGLMVYEYYYPMATGKELPRVGSKMLSPFRDEHDPSFSIYLSKAKGKYLFKDHGIDKVGSHYQFVMDIYGIDFKEAITKIKSDILGITDNGISSSDKTLKAIKRAYQRPVHKEQVRSEIYPIYRNWNDYDSELWDKYQLTEYTLSKFHVSPVSVYDLKKEDKTIRIKAHDNDPIYDILMPRSGRHKMYRPLTKDPSFKWVSNTVADEDVFGFDLLPKESNDLFLISGNKDTMIFSQHIGLPCIALASESANLTEELYSFLRHMASNIWVLYDNDKQGYRKAEMFKEQFGLPSLNHIYEKMNVNDLGDIAKKGLSEIDEFRFLLTNNITNTNIR